jgi:PhnB protein
MIKAAAHLHFEGRCAEAFRFYEKCLGGKTTFSMTWGQAPVGKEMPAGWADKIIHARFEFGDQFFTADDPPPQFYAKPQGLDVLLLFQDPAKAERIYKMLSENAKEIRMPFAKTFWSPGYASFVDQFGIPWMINCEAAQA